MKGFVVSLILRTAATYMLPLLLLFSVFLLLGGHNEPGGGFVGGLTAASAFILYGLAFDVERAKVMLRVNLIRLVGVGLGLAALSGFFQILMGDPYLTSAWVTIPLPGLGELKLGTPLLFDIGVYLVVLSVSLIITMTLAEQ
ncbi:MAG: Na+/H+ antiporter subunit B [Phycisphaerales bacterium]|nr:MAG: Na+/H+ antiporter subunit B [Phycisphaerales bacterium]